MKKHISFLAARPLANGDLDLKSVFEMYSDICFGFSLLGCIGKLDSHCHSIKSISEAARNFVTSDQYIQESAHLLPNKMQHDLHIKIKQIYVMEHFSNQELSSVLCLKKTQTRRFLLFFNFKKSAHQISLVINRHNDINLYCSDNIAIRNSIKQTSRPPYIKENTTSLPDYVAGYISTMKERSHELECLTIYTVILNEKKEKALSLKNNKRAYSLVNC